MLVALSGCMPSNASAGADFGQVDAPLDVEITEQLDAVLGEAIDLSGSSGGVAGVWAPWAGEWQSAVGTLEFDANEPVVVDTPIRMATSTGDLTCMIMLQMVDGGVVALDDPVNEYVDSPGLEGITLEHLCRQTSGLADYYSALRSNFIGNPERAWSPSELISTALAAPAVAAPGARYSESRSGVILLGQALERASHRSWSELAQQYVLDPLDLEQTRIPNANAGAVSGALGAYLTGTTDGDLDCSARLDRTVVSSALGGAAAGGVTTLDELHRLNDAIATGMLLDEQVAAEQWRLTSMGAGVPSWYQAAVGSTQYGPMRGSAGEQMGALTAAITDPETGLSVVVALNNATSGAEIVLQSTFALASIASKAMPVDGGAAPLVELPWSAEQARSRMVELAKCPITADAATEE